MLAITIPTVICQFHQEGGRARLLTENGEHSKWSNVGQRPNGYRVDRNWTQVPRKAVFSRPGLLLVGELAQLPHYPK